MAEVFFSHKIAGNGFLTIPPLLMARPLRNKTPIFAAALSCVQNSTVILHAFFQPNCETECVEKNTALVKAGLTTKTVVDVDAALETAKTANTAAKVKKRTKIFALPTK